MMDEIEDFCMGVCILLIMVSMFVFVFLWVVIENAETSCSEDCSAIGESGTLVNASFYPITKASCVCTNTTTNQTKEIWIRGWGG